MTRPDDNGSRRQALYAKRDELRARHAERTAQQAHDAKVANFHLYVGGALEAAGVRYECLWSNDDRRGPLTTYPIGFASIHWDLVPHAVGTSGGNEAWLKDLFDEALVALAIAPGTTVIVDWCRDALPRVALSAADASAHAVDLMRGSADMWVYAPDATWMIEVYHEGKLTYADRPGLPEHAGNRWRPTGRGDQRARAVVASDGAT